MTTPVTNKQYEINAARLETISTAMLIVCSMALIGLGTLKPPDLDWSLKMSLGCFAVGLPASCLGFMVGLERRYFGKSLLNFTDYPIMILLFPTSLELSEFRQSPAVSFSRKVTISATVP